MEWKTVILGIVSIWLIVAIGTLCIVSEQNQKEEIDVTELIGFEHIEKTDMGYLFTYRASNTTQYNFNQMLSLVCVDGMKVSTGYSRVFDLEEGRYYMFQSLGEVDGLKADYTRMG